jgi:hypothetical protein
MQDKSEKQQRHTLIDCENSQFKMMKDVKKLKAENKPVDSKMKQLFLDNMTMALLSQGSNEEFHIKLKGVSFIFAHFQSFGMRLCMDLNTSFVKLSMKEPYDVEVAVPISDLWEIFLSKLPFFMSRSRSEAMRSSAEHEKREEQGAYGFGSEGAI